MFEYLQTVENTRLNLRVSQNLFKMGLPKSLVRSASGILVSRLYMLRKSKTAFITGTLEKVPKTNAHEFLMPQFLKLFSRLFVKLYLVPSFLSPSFSPLQRTIPYHLFLSFALSLSLSRLNQRPLFKAAKFTVGTPADKEKRTAFYLRSRLVSVLVGVEKSERGRS